MWIRISKLRGQKAYHNGHTDIMDNSRNRVGQHIQLYFNEINVLYSTRFFVESSISDLEVVLIFKFRGREPDHDLHTGTMVIINTCNFMKC